MSTADCIQKIEKMINSGHSIGTVVCLVQSKTKRIEYSGFALEHLIHCNVFV